MRKLLSTAATAAGLSVAMVASAVAAPVQGFGAERDALYGQLYAAVFTSCSGPGANVDALTAAIDAYSSQLVGDGVPLEVALLSFTQVRGECAAANAGNVALLASIDGVFEGLLPETGSIGPDVSPA